MTSEFSLRKSGWTQPPRPEWVRKINEEGRYLDIKSVIPLDENALLETAKRNVGLSDFGDDNWYEPFKILIKSLEEEAELNLIGRLMTRSDLLLNLQARLQIEDAYKRFPEIDEQVVKKPFIIVGQSRTGTSAMQNMLSMDPNNGTTPHWEVLFPCPPSETESYGKDWRVARADGLMTSWNRVTPEFAAMHEWSGNIPAETIQLDCLCFRSPGWINSVLGQVPTYTAYMASQDDTLIFEYQKRVLKLLQWKNPRKNWVLKSPTYVSSLPELLSVYPDAGIIWTHRDPVKALSSAINVLGTSFYVRSDTSFIGDTLANFTDANLCADMLTKPIEWLESGVVPSERVCNIHFDDFMEDPIKVAENIYSYFEVEFTPEGKQSIVDYMDKFPRSSRPSHQYSTEGGALSAERAAFKRYQEYFNVPSEV